MESAPYNRYREKVQRKLKRPSRGTQQGNGAATELRVALWPCRAHRDGSTQNSPDEMGREAQEPTITGRTPERLPTCAASVRPSNGSRYTLVRTCPNDSLALQRHQELRRTLIGQQLCRDKTNSGQPGAQDGQTRNRPWHQAGVVIVETLEARNSMQPPMSCGWVVAHSSVSGQSLTSGLKRVRVGRVLYHC